MSDKHEERERDELLSEREATVDALHPHGGIPPGDLPSYVTRLRERAEKAEGERDEIETILACTADKAASVLRSLSLGDMIQNPWRSFAVRDAISDIEGEIGVMRQNHLVAVDDLTKRAQKAEADLAAARKRIFKLEVALREAPSHPCTCIPFRIPCPGVCAGAVANAEVSFLLAESEEVGS